MSEEEFNQGGDSTFEDNILKQTNTNNNISGLDLTGLAADDRPDELDDNGFGMVHSPKDNNQPNYPQPPSIFEDNNAGGGLGDAMGLNDNGGSNDYLAMEEEMMGLGGAGDQLRDPSGIPGETLSITVFIGLDEDDSNSLGLDLRQLFQADGSLPFHVEVSC